MRKSESIISIPDQFDSVKHDHLSAESKTSRKSSVCLKFMFAPLSWVLAHTSRTVEIGKELRRRGHEVIFLGEDPDNPRSKLHLVREAGFPIVRTREPYQPLGWDRFVKYGWVVSLWDLLHLAKWVPLQGIIEDQVNAIRTEKPDIIIGDASVSVSTAAYIAGIPAACIMNGYASHFLTSRSVFHPALLAYDWLHLARIRKRAYDLFDTRPVNSLCLLRSIPLISPDLEGLYENPSYFPNYHTVGPIFSEHPSPLPSWYDELDDGKDNIYITMGSTGFLDLFLKRTYEVLAKLPYRFVVTTAGQVSEETAHSAPDNFRLCNYAPGSQLLSRCRGMIFHGGNGTMYQALGQGVPMIALTSHLEQDVIARIAANKGFCIRMPARGFKVAKLVDNIEAIMRDGQHRKAALKFSSLVRSSNGIKNAADLLERFAREGHPAGYGL